MISFRNKFTREPPRIRHTQAEILARPGAKLALAGLAASVGAAPVGAAPVVTITEVSPPEPTDSGQLVDYSATPLFSSPLSIHDVHQGRLADCYYLAVIAGIIFQRPDLIPHIIGRYDAAHAKGFFYIPDNYPKVNIMEIGVDTLLETGDAAVITSTYVPLLEKMYVWFRGGRQGNNTWASLNWGYEGSALMDLGFTYSWLSTMDTALDVKVAAVLSSTPPQMVYMGTNSNIVNAPLIGSHVYAVIGVNLAANPAQSTFLVYNPWGVDGAGGDSDPNDGCVTLTVSQLQGNSSYLTISTSYVLDAAPPNVIPVTPPPLSSGTAEFVSLNPSEYWRGTEFIADFHATDGKAHRLTFYLLDHGNLGRTQRVDVLDANGNVLDTKTVSDFAGGKYLIWNLSGHAQLRFTCLAGPDAVLSGVFFGPVGAVAPVSAVVSVAVSGAIIASS